MNYLKGNIEEAYKKNEREEEREEEERRGVNISVSLSSLTINMRYLYVDIVDITIHRGETMLVIHYLCFVCLGIMLVN